jgi:APA family basic amino acid/polyamine antiporter
VVNTEGGGAGNGTEGAERNLGMLDATGVVVSSIVGIGIFLTVPDVARALPTPGWFFGMWMVCGVLSLMGALANAELGTLFPQAGGSYTFARHAFGPSAAFASGCLCFFGVYAGTVATLAVGLVDAARSVVPIAEGARMPISVAIVAVLTALNAMGTRRVARINAIVAFAKVAAMVLVFGAAAKVSATDSLPSTGQVEPSLRAASKAFSPVLFSYLGWNASVFIANHVREPRKNIPRSVVLGLAISTIVYLALNASFVRVLGLGAMANAQDVGSRAMVTAFGTGAQRLFSTLVLVSIGGTLIANAFVGPRIVYAMAKEGALPARLGSTHADGTPMPAFWAQGIAAIAIIVVLRKFPSALDFTTFATVLATTADVVAVFVMRKKLPQAPRYACPGYPWLPAVYVIVHVGIAVAIAWNSPREAGIGTLLLVLAFAFEARRTRSRRAKAV